jgi:predicted nuclease of restriction endonuclease-like RecB superfamily
VLTADHVLARRRGAELVIRPLAAAERVEAAHLAAQLVPIFQEGVGRSREEIEGELGSIEVSARHQRLKDGLVKLLEDRCDWGAGHGWGAGQRIDPAQARREVFLMAAQVRAALGDGEPFDRSSVLARVAEGLAVDADALERALYADLRGANVLSKFDAPSPLALVDAYDRGQVQAVLLRAVRVKVEMRCASAVAARSLFRRLKFLGLLYTMERAEDGYRLVIDGPLSLFQSVTKYGHRIAQLVPLLEPLGAFTLEADLRWGKERVPLTFRTRGVDSREPRRAPPAADELTLSDDLAELVRAFRALETGFRVSPSRVVLDLPGTGLCVPDLVFVRGKETIYFEALGYWSREAVFRRVDLVEKGLAEKILFAASGRLRVSEEVIADDAPAALYVYKGTMKARAVADRLERLASRASVGPSD